MIRFPWTRRVVAAALVCLCAGPFLPAAIGQESSARAPTQPERAFDRGAPVPSWVERISAIPAETATEALSIRLADVQFHIADIPAFYQHKAITAHEASSLGSLGQVDIEFQPAYQRVQLHKLSVLRGRETIDKLPSADIRFLQRERSLEQGVYDGSVTAQIVTTDLRVGDTLEIEYSVSGQNPVFGRHVMQAAQWDFPSPVALRRVIVEMPVDKMVDYRVIGATAGSGAQLRQSASSRNGRNVLRFEATAMPAALGESYVPFDVHQYRWLQFSDFRDWADVNAWALDLFSAQTAAGVLEAPLRAARAAKTKEEAVAKVLEFVQNDIRYLSVSMGENSHRPFPPAQVLERRYGDCKDKSLLAVTILRALGIEAYPVLVASYTTVGLDNMLPSPTLFDHAIVRVKVNGKEYYLDPTRNGQYGSLDRMGQTHGGRQVLVIKPDTTALTTIPQPSGDAIKGKRIERIEVSAMDKPAELIERVEMVGAAAENLRAQLGRMSKQELRKAYEGALIKRYPEAQLAGDPRIEDDRVRNSVSIEVRHVVPNLFVPSANGDSWSMNYTPSNLTELFAPPGNARRRFPLAVPLFPESREYDLTVNLPVSFAMAPARQSRNVDDQAFRLVRVLDVGKRSLHINMALSALEDRVQPVRMPQYLKNTQQYTEMLGGSLRVFKADMTGGAPAKIVQLPNDQARLEQVVASTARVIADAEALGRDPSGALCERALAHAWLGRKLEAQKDVVRVAQMQSHSNEALRCRADVFFILGRFKESEADYAKLIARGADQADNFQGRGLSNLYLNKPAAARADFRAAITKAEGEAERMRAVIWYRLAGGADNLPPLATDDADLAWLSEVATMFAGTVEPEHMLSRAARNLLAGMDGRLVEAYYYAGRYYQAKGEALKARAFFQRAVDKRVLDSAYHVVAQHELSR